VWRVAEWEAARRAREEGGEDAVALRLRRADDDKRRKMAEFDDKARASRALADEMGAREAALRERQANAELAREQALQQLYDMNRAKAAAYNQGMRAVYTQYIIIIIIIIIIVVFIYHTRTEHKIQKFNSVNKSMKGYQRSCSSLNWPPMLIKQNHLA